MCAKVHGQGHGQHAAPAKAINVIEQNSNGFNGYGSVPYSSLSNRWIQENLSPGGWA